MQALPSWLYFNRNNQSEVRSLSNGKGTAVEGETECKILPRRPALFQIARANISEDGKGIFINVALPSSNLSDPLDLAYEVVGYPGYKEARQHFKVGFSQLFKQAGKEWNL